MHLVRLMHGFIIIYVINAQVCYTDPVMQAQAFITQALHHRAIVTNKGIFSIHYGKMS